MTIKKPSGNFIVVALITLMSASSALSQDWEIVNSPFEDNITGICSVHPDTFFVVSSKGKCARTDDDGKTWQVFQVTAGVPLEDVSFVDSKLGLVCGRRGVLYRTTDGGSTWESRSPADTLPWFMDVEMFDSHAGLVIGMSRDSISPLKGLGFRTSDGGLTWKRQKMLGMGYAEIQHRPGEPVYLLSFGRLHRSDDLGKSWESIDIGDQMLARTVSIFGKTGILAGPNGMYAFSSDTGKTWAKLNQENDKVYIAAEMVDEKEGYIGGTGNAMLHTTDGGHTWNTEPLVGSFNVLDMGIVGDRLIAVGSEGTIIARKVK